MATNSFTLTMKHKKSTKHTEVYEVEEGQQAFVKTIYVSKGAYLTEPRPERIELTVVACA